MNGGGNVTRGREDTKLYRSKLIETYLELWDVVNDTQQQMRRALSDGLEPRDRAKLIGGANDFMIRAGIFIERQDRILVLDYLACTNEYFDILAKRGDPNELFVSMPHYELDSNVSQMIGAQERADVLRDELRERVRLVAGMKDSGGWSPDVKPSRDLVLRLRQLEAGTEPTP